MSVVPEASVAPWKRELVEELQKKFEDYPVVGILDITGIPAKQFQQMREVLRGDAEIKVSRRVLLRIAIEKASEEETELEELIDYLKGQTALIFTELDSFSLQKLLDENKTSAPAKTGMESPEDIVIPEGETDFSPGPIIGELQRAGIQAQIQAGKVMVTEDSKIVSEGEPIPKEAVGVLSRFGIEPREIGFDLKATYEDRAVFPGDVLEVDEEENLKKVLKAQQNSLSLSLEIQYPTEESIRIMIGKAYSEAKGLAIEASFFTSETAPRTLSKTQSEMLSLASAIAEKDPEALGKELSEKISQKTTATEREEEKKEEKTKEEAEEEKTGEEEEAEEEEEVAGMGELF